MAAQALQWSNWEWQDMPMPDANAGVQLAPLAASGSDHFLAMVRFPPGWHRLHAGHYAVDEAFFVLAGDLHINGLCWQAQQHGVVPAHVLRHDTHSDAGCTVYARFHGRPRWIRGKATCQAAGAIRHTTDWRRIAADEFDPTLLPRP